jgi:prepilin-type N-terminal cleavage/methylation domain-containing protein
MIRRAWCDDSGFTLAEVLSATAIVAIGFVAAALAFQHAIAGIEIGRGETAATFLAERKLEALKALALADWTNAALTPATTTEYCPPSGGDCTATPAAGWYRRATTVIDGPGGTCATNCKLVRVTVFYRPVGSEGQLEQERRVDVSTMFASRA